MRKRIILFVIAGFLGIVVGIAIGLNQSDQIVGKTVYPIRSSNWTDQDWLKFQDGVEILSANGLDLTIKTKDGKKYVVSANDFSLYQEGSISIAVYREILYQENLHRLREAERLRREHDWIPDWK